MSGEFPDVLDGIPHERLTLEITEHTDAEDYQCLLDVLQPLRRRGLKLAVDDAGAGYSSLRHILNLQPDFIKLDMDLVRRIDLDPARRALASALISFARDTNSSIVAEGVETASEFATLQALGVEQRRAISWGARCRSGTRWRGSSRRRHAPGMSRKPRRYLPRAISPSQPRRPTRIAVSR